MVNALHSGSDPHRSGFEPWPGTLCCVPGQNILLLIVPLCTQVYKWITASLLLEGRPWDGLDPIQGGVEILLVMLHATETTIGFALMSHLARMQI